MDVGAPELLIILVIVAMLFGVGKLPEIFGAVGKGVREFRKGMADPDEASGAKTEPPSPPSSDKS
ncbi:MAG: twin-arginine translocase TatA/TatE family subunit [Chloroflexi bacterium]|nr:twin-arginine translocase TatA/TatE family subunit [Chloroflexota bacterium]